MSEDGTNIRNMIKQMKEFYEQISLLLRTIDAYMKKEKWESINNYAISGFSRHISFPSWWQPTEVFRFYLNKEQPKRYCFASILLDDDRDGRYELKEPVVTGGYFDYASDEEANKDDDYFSYSKLYGILSKNKNIIPDGKIFSIEKNSLPSDFQCKFESGDIFGIPLTEIMDEKDVKLRIVERLLSALNRKD